MNQSSSSPSATKEDYGLINTIVRTKPRPHQASEKSIKAGQDGRNGNTGQRQGHDAQDISAVAGAAAALGRHKIAEGSASNTLFVKVCPVFVRHSHEMVGGDGKDLAGVDVGKGLDQLFGFEVDHIGFLVLASLNLGGRHRCRWNQRGRRYRCGRYQSLGLPGQQKPKRICFRHSRRRSNHIGDGWSHRRR